MTDRTFELTRRKLLGAAGAVGVAGAGAGVGTSALFSDEESFEDNTITAGTLDMSVTAEVVAASEYYTDSGDGPNVVGEMETADGDAVVGLQASDVKPGDWVIICFDVSVEDNPGYVQVSTESFAQYENGQTEPEIDAEGADSNAGSLGGDLDGQGKGELQDELVAEVYGTYDSDSDNSPPESYLDDPEPSLSGSARTVFEQFATGVVLGGSATPLEVGSDGVERYLLLELPRDVGNEVQSDAMEFDLVFEAEQVRNNDGFEPSSNLVGYWPLNGVGDGTAADLSGNGNDGTVVGDVSPAGGQVAGAGAFDGSGGRVEIPDDPSLGVTNVTVSAWVYRDGSKNREYIVDGRNHNYGIKLEDGTSKPLFFVNAPNSDSLTAGTNIPDQTWTHVVGTYDGSEVKLYVDGTAEATGNGSGDIATTAGPARIGDYIQGGYKFRGRIDDVRVYDRALSSSEVTEIYNETN